MEVAIGNAPFRREVREWQRVDPNTGALVTGRLEADRWISGQLNTYGKVVDSQNVSTPNGTQLSQRKQLEVLQTRTSSGSLQVVRAHTVQTSSSRWSTSHHQHSTSDVSHDAASVPHNSFKSVFQRQQLVEPQTQFKHISLPTEISTKLNVGVALTQLDLTNERETLVNSHSLFNRGKSVSNEDLTAERDAKNFDDDVEPVEWRRVSKIRRSLQLPKTSTARNSYSRPPDLPEYSVSVSKIKEELENGRRLNTAMRNNHVDLVALDNILNGVSETGHRSDLKCSKKTTFITAESLKEIRGKLKRLSDESLYKDDMSQCDDQEEPGEVFVPTNLIKTDEIIASENTQVCLPKFSIQSNNITSNNNLSLRETRSKVKDTSSSDWYSRRKSYGFEKMTPSPDSSSKMLESTDSGIGRSGELSNLWSPIETSPKGTIVSLGEYNLKHNNSSTYITLLNDTHDIKQTQFSPNKQTNDETKRHSIAVDEAKYVRDNLRRVFETKTSVHLNGMYSDDSSQNNSDDKDGRKSKRVEFCKTEVHFAAESGRVNIVETDGKPPPTNNFRRRRRVTNSSSNIGTSFLEAINSGIPVTHFGDVEKKTKVEFLSTPTNVTTSIVKTTFSEALNTKKEEDEQLDETSIRGILKNKPVKPKPYHLGENIDSGESLWGVRLRPVSSEFRNFKPSSGIEDDNDVIGTNELDLSDPSCTRLNDAQRYKSDISAKQETSSYKLSLLSNSSNFSWHNKEYKFTSGKSDVVHSNVLSIALHSPTCLTKSYSTQNPPIAKPRTVTPVIKTQPMETTTKSNRKINTSGKKEDAIENGSTKLTSGTRKLRDHELSYFGISLPKYPPDFRQPISLTSKLSVNQPMSPTKIDPLQTKIGKRNKWQLSNDKPDLLRHSPTAEKVSDYGRTKSVIENSKSSKTVYTSNEPVYENLRKKSNYNRKNDLERDEMILTELSEAADQILSTVSVTTNETIGKTVSPKVRLQTIEENKSTQKIMQSKGIQVSRGFSDSLRKHRTTRVSSESSNESTLRSSSLNQKVSGNNTKRLCSKIHESDARSGSVASSNKSTRRRVTSSSNSHRLHRTSSRDTLNSHASSSEDLPNSTDVAVPRRPRRVRTKEKPESQQSSVVIRSNSSQMNSSTRTGTDRLSIKKSNPSDNSTLASRGRNLTDQQSKTRVRSGVTTTTSPSRRNSRNPDGIWK